MRPPTPSIADSIIPLTALAWITLTLALGALEAISLPNIASLTDRPPLAVLPTLASLTLCTLAARHTPPSQTPSPLHHLPTLLASLMLYLAVDAQITGFHEPPPSALEHIALCLGAALVAIVGRLILRAAPTRQSVLRSIRESAKLTQ